MRKTILTATIAVSLLLCLISIVLNDIPCRDVAGRYAPMAEAFAEGDWLYAFHPRIQPLQIVSGGIIAYLLPCNGFMALKIASALWFLAGMFVIWKLFRELYENTPWIAAAATAFYALYPYNIRMAAEGLRESCKTFILILIACGLVKIYKNLKDYAGYLWLGCGCSLALISRADMIMTGIFLLYAGLTLECREKKFPGLSIISLTMTAVSIVLSSLLNYYVCGQAMPDYRFAEIFEKAVNHPAGITDIAAVTLALCAMICAAAMVTARLLRKIHAGVFLAALIFFMLITSVFTAISNSDSDVLHFIASIIGGSGNAIAIFSLGTILYLIWKRQFTGGEFLLCLVMLANTFFNIVPIQLFHKDLYVSDRYLYTAVPLQAGFFVLGIQFIYQYIRSRCGDQWAKYAAAISCASISIAFVFCALSPTLRAHTGKKDALVRKGTLALASAIQNDYHGAPYRTGAQDQKQYSSKKAPFVSFDENKKYTAAAYMAGGSSVSSTQEDPDYFAGSIIPDEFANCAIKITEINFGKYSKTLWRIEK